MLGNTVSFSGFSLLFSLLYINTEDYERTCMELFNKKQLLNN